MKVYIAGPYSATNVIDALRNIGRGQETALKVFQAGHSPFCPWFDKEFVIQSWGLGQNVDRFKEYSMDFLRVCDAVLVVPNRGGMINWQDSPGTLAEIKEAKRLKIPVCYDMEDLYWLGYKRQKNIKE